MGTGKLVSVYAEPHQVAMGTRELKIRTETYGSGDARFSLNVNGRVFHEEDLNLNGFEAWEYYLPLEGVPPGLSYVQGVLTFNESLSDKADWFEMTDKAVPGPSDDPTKEYPVLVIDGVQLRDDTPVVSSVDEMPGATPTIMGEMLQIPAMNLFGILVLMIILGACFVRIGRNR
jgi:hypothetical protein